MKHPANARFAIKAWDEKPYSEGVLEERKLFMELMSGTQARAQQYFFFAERKAAKIENIPEDTQPSVTGPINVVIPFVLITWAVRASRS